MFLTKTLYKRRAWLRVLFAHDSAASYCRGKRGCGGNAERPAISSAATWPGQSEPMVAALQTHFDQPSYGAG